jgi:hypothetical protein
MKAMRKATMADVTDVVATIGVGGDIMNVAVTIGVGDIMNVAATMGVGDIMNVAVTIGVGDIMNMAVTIGDIMQMAATRVDLTAVVFPVVATVS